MKCDFIFSLFSLLCCSGYLQKVVMWEITFSPKFGSEMIMIRREKCSVGHYSVHLKTLYFTVQASVNLWKLLVPLSIAFRAASEVKSVLFPPLVLAPAWKLRHNKAGIYQTKRRTFIINFICCQKGKQHRIPSSCVTRLSAHILESCHLLEGNKKKPFPENVA